MSFITPWADLKRSFSQLITSVQKQLPLGLNWPPRATDPIRGELFSTEQLEQHAQALAAEHSAIDKAGNIRVLQAVLARNERMLRDAYRALAEDAGQRRPVTPAAEWLLDNMHVITDQIREIRQDLPAGYYHQLLKLTRGPQKGMPRVYALALQLIEHTDGRIDLEQLIRFVLAYQSVTPLKMGELWAIAIMLRTGLIDNLGRLARITIDARLMRAEADTWADRLLSAQDSIGVSRNPVLQELAAHYPELSLTFTVQLLRRIRSYEGDLDIDALITWLEQHTAAPFTNAEQMIHAEHQRQAANQVSVANTVTSMRTLSTIDWADWFDRVSHVEQILRQDPARAYHASTFATRDRYRHEIELLARNSSVTEIEVARRVVARAATAKGANRPAHETHVGYYLADEGRAAFEIALGYRATPDEIIRRAMLHRPTQVYLGAIGATTAAVIAAGLKLTQQHQKQESSPMSPGSRALALSLLALPASALATELVNRWVSQILKPRVLPRLDLRSGIPAEYRTIVVIPSLLLTPDSIRGQLESMEVLYLANEDPHLHFALLSDFADADSEAMPEDEQLLNAAVEQVRLLNERYGADRFFLMHRRRVWNPQQGRWMGWERKRGKLEEFNQLLIGAEDTTYEIQIGDLRILPQIRYVITLDADTQLPRDAAQAMIGTIAHPLNQAELDPTTSCVVRGYGILQPRVGIDLPSATKSRFARLSSGNIGIDPYTTAVSDVYMDLFGEGIYAGKGIYDPQAFRAALHDRFPDNTLLSHDLIEGNYARAGLLSDVELLDGYPTTYAAYAARQHRWIRGDWQIAGWLLPWVPRASGGSTPNVLSPIARYKMFDNLRRSLVPPATMALLVAGWRWLPGPAWAWTAAGLAHLAIRPLLDLIDTGFSLAGGAPPKSKLQQLRFSGLRFLMNVALLPDQAVLNIDAIIRTLYRMGVTHQNLLEWETAAQAQTRLDSSAGVVARRIAPLLALVGGATRLTRAVPGSPTLAEQLSLAGSIAPVVSSWLGSPALVAWLDQPWIQIKPEAISDEDLLMLRRLSRTTWSYFERFTTEEAHYLAPDNFQETPNPVQAQRTSPTNIGLQLLAALAAHDLGYLGLLELTKNTRRVFETIERLELYRGHLLNWYDTVTLKPLPPAYISTVDSGNLAGFLFALRQGYLEFRNRPIAGPWICNGLQDTLAVIEERLPADASAARIEVHALAQILAQSPSTIAEYRTLLHTVAERAAEMRASGPVADWIGALRRQADSFLADLELLLPTEHTDNGDVQIETEPVDWEHAPPPTLNQLAALPAVKQLLEQHQAIINTCAKLVYEMDFSFLYNDRRRLFSIGYSVVENRLDNSFYDLLASESRIASFIAIAKGDVPQEHWFHLGRTLTPAGDTSTLVSWSGTMFEYLMPLLIMHTFPETLLDSTYQGAVAQQISYGKRRDIPWGISESAYNIRDLSMNYQYRAFGVPGLGLKSGLVNDLVIAPYATVLALPVQPAATVKNIRTLIAQGAYGAHGLYEAIDYTEDRLPPSAKSALVRCFMVHHQGMSLLALNNYLNHNSMRRRFHSEPMVQATETLLQEQIPTGTPLRLPQEAAESPVAIVPSAPTTHQFTTAGTAVPYTHLLSNGSYSVMVTNAGGSASTYKDLAVTRWRSDTTRDNWGSFYYIRDVRSGIAWSAGHQPLRQASQGYRVTYALEKVEFYQRFAGIDTRMEITVSPEDDAEVRRISLSNLTSEPRELEITSYAEIVLAPPGADAAHPAFSNLFVETEFVHERDALLASRRPRSATSERTWAVHVVAARGRTSGAVEYETDRMAFVGRGRNLADPQALHQPLGRGAGAVLDPIFSLRRRIRIVPGGVVQLFFTIAIANSREQALRLVDKYHDSIAGTRAFEMAWTQNQVELRHLNMTAEQAHRFQRLATFALYSDRVRRAPVAVLRKNTRGQSNLWAYGISGDYPIILARIGASEEVALVHELLMAHEYWRLKGLLVDLVILNEDSGGYMQGLQDQILSQVRSSRAGGRLNQRGGIFILRTDLVPEPDKILLQTAARIILSGRRGDLSQHLRRREADIAPFIAPVHNQNDQVPINTETPPWKTGEQAQLQLRSPYGGFTPDGREYVIELEPGTSTPAPWINVIANQNFGFIVSERGAGYTWSENSRENRLTPWSNDPVSDPGGEAIFVRDEASNAYWSPTPYPAGVGSFRIRHGFGYSVFEHRRNQIDSELTMFVPPSDSVKIYRLRLTNRSPEPRRLSATLYVEWVLGVFREQMAPYIITEMDTPSGALLARNPYNQEFADRVAFIAAQSGKVALNGDRGEFIGRNGDLSYPAAMQRQFSQNGTTPHGHIGAGLDPAGVVRYLLELEPGQEADVIFVLGQGSDLEEAHQLIERYREPASATAALEETIEHWRTLVGQLTVRTPQPELNVLLNGWLLYQNLVCRVWGRSAFYQSGGAYGYRDQLQDVMALTNTAPNIAHEQIVRAASRQFVQGDVQHWWHPPSGRGIRTSFSDDYLWLPLVTHHYVTATGDNGVLDEVVSFLEGRPLADGEAEYYDMPTISDQRGSVYEHCLRAIDYGLGRMGAHGLPLMGAGDWNDGMNMVGHDGRGESVWVGWFLYLILNRFAEICERRSDNARAARYRAEAQRLQAALEEHAWDGAWYLRAFYDDGTPLGSNQSDECRIDSLSQSWAVISGAANPERAARAMDAVEEHLIDRPSGLIRLFTPPFDRTTHNPGYIKGYLPGVRENGGQYTHAALWVIWAYALLGRGDRVGELIQLINPVRHGLANPERYKVEPYTIAADVYAVLPHTGRGGWTWYTGSAGWFYRLGVEALLGLRREGDTLVIQPCIPPDWSDYTLCYHHGKTRYCIHIENPHGVSTGVAELTLDGEALSGGRIPLSDDGQSHDVEIVLGAVPVAASGE